MKFQEKFFLSILKKSMTCGENVQCKKSKVKKKYKIGAGQTQTS